MKLLFLDAAVVGPPTVGLLQSAVFAADRVGGGGGEVGRWGGGGYFLSSLSVIVEEYHVFHAEKGWMNVLEWKRDHIRPHGSTRWLMSKSHRYNTELDMSWVVFLTQSLVRCAF